MSKIKILKKDGTYELHLGLYSNLAIRILDTVFSIFTGNSILLKMHNVFLPCDIGGQYTKRASDKEIIMIFNSIDPKMSVYWKNPARYIEWKNRCPANFEYEFCKRQIFCGKECIKGLVIDNLIALIKNAMKINLDMEDDFKRLIQYLDKENDDEELIGEASFNPFLTESMNALKKEIEDARFKFLKLHDEYNRLAGRI